MTEKFDNEKMKLISIIREIVAIMRHEGERNWVRNFLEMDEVLRENKCKSNADWIEVKKYIYEIYRNMNNGMGTFSDFHIWRDDFEERKKKNDYFKLILKEFEKIIIF